MSGVDASTVILTLVGVGIIVVGTLLLLQMKTVAAAPMVVREVRRHPPAWWGPTYYSRVPYRHLVY